MARSAAGLPAGIRLTDQISLGVLTAQFPMEIVEQVLFETERFSARERDLPAHVMVYYAIALALYAEVSTREVLRCVLEGARWLGDSLATTMPSKSAISQARTRLGAGPTRGVVSRRRRPGGDGGHTRRVVSRVAGHESRRDDARRRGHEGERAGLRSPGECARGECDRGLSPDSLVGLLENETHAICGG